MTTTIDDLTPHDQREVERFAIFLRLVGQATRAGLEQHEAERAIYPDVYGPCDLHDPGLYP